MKPVQQTTFGVGNGNCLSACIASILEIGIEEVPNFCHEDAGEDGLWMQRASEWLIERGYGVVYAKWDVDIVSVNAWCIVSGKPEGGGDDHAVVGLCVPDDWVPGKCKWKVKHVFDPNPNGTVIEEIKDLLFLVPGCVDWVDGKGYIG